MKIHRRYLCVGIAVFVIILVPLLVIDIRQSRVRQFRSIEAQVEKHGGSLSWELVDGNYHVQLSGQAANNEVVKSISAVLRELPTGFTFLGPGESRLFHVHLDSTLVEEDGFASLLHLPVEFLFLNGGTVTNQTATDLANHQSLIWIQLDNVSVSEDARRLIRKQKPDLVMTLEGDVQ